MKGFKKQGNLTRNVDNTMFEIRKWMAHLSGRMFVALFVLILCSAFSALCAADESILVLAGAAGKPVLEEAARRFEQETGVSVELKFGGSGKLLSEVILSGKGDVYIPASADYLVKAAGKGLIATGSETILAYFVPALCVSASNPLRLETLSDLANKPCRIGLGRPETVAIGGFSLELLQKSGHFEVLQPKIVTYFDDYSRLMTALELGSIDVTVGWLNCEHWFGKHLRSIPLAAGEIPRISTYEGAVLTTARHAGTARKFLDLLCSSAGKEIFQKQYYITDREETQKCASGAELNGAPIYRLVE